MILWKISLREIRSHRGRAILTAASIVIGVAAVVAVNLASVAVRASFGAMQQTIAGEAALEVIPAGDNVFEEGVVDQVAEIPGVRAASPVYQRTTVMYVGGREEGSETRKVMVVLLGVDPKHDESMRDYGVTAGRTIEEGDEILLDSAFAQSLGLAVGAEVRMPTPGGIRPVPFTIVGLLRPLTGAAVGRGSVLFMPLATAQRRFRQPGRINKIQIALEDSAEPEAVQAAVAQSLPTGLTVRSSMSQSQMGEETMRSIQNALWLATTFALVAAVFIVGNAFFMNVTQRQRQLAVMRAIGATKLQVWRLILREALILAVLGTAVGLVVGWGGAVLLSEAMEQLFRTDLPVPQLTTRVLFLAIAFGLVVSILGAVLPARRASKVEPVEGMHDVSRSDVEGAPRWFVTAGATGFIVSGVWLAAILSGAMPPADDISARVHQVFATANLPDPVAPGVKQPLSWVVGRFVTDYVLAAIIFLVFVVPVIPLVLTPLSRAASFLLRPFARAEARIARQQLLRRRVRTTLTIGVLFVASSTGLGLASTVLDNIRDVQQWYRRVMAGDFFIRVLTPDLVAWTTPQLPPGVEEEVRAVPGIDTAFGVRFAKGEVRDPNTEEMIEVMLTVRDYPTAGTITADLVDLSPEEMRERMLRGEATLGSVLAQRLKLQRGDTLQVQTSEGLRDLPIAGVINDYMGGGLVVHMDRNTGERFFGIQGIDAVVVRAKPERKAEVEVALRQIAEKYQVLFQSYSQLTDEIDRMLTGVIGGLWVVMILGLLVASMGVMNTLSMNVLEQTRELAMLRVVAMTRGQARRTVLAQAAILGTIGLAPGVLVGVGLAWLFNLSLLRTIGREVTFGVHPWLAVSGLATALVLVVLAAWIPAQRAANLEPIQALRYE
jgi:putative ABC transport system permease protein